MELAVTQAVAGGERPGRAARGLGVWGLDAEGVGLDSGRELASFKVDAALLCCAVCPDGKTILAGDKNGVIHVLRLE